MSSTIAGAAGGITSSLQGSGGGNAQNRARAQAAVAGITAVSYTHLTLPTKRIV